jgi:hypothetical protein
MATLVIEHWPSEPLVRDFRGGATCSWDVTGTGNTAQISGQLGDVEGAENVIIGCPGCGRRHDTSPRGLARHHRLGRSLLD